MNALQQPEFQEARREVEDHLDAAIRALTRIGYTVGDAAIEVAELTRHAAARVRADNQRAREENRERRREASR